MAMSEPTLNIEDSPAFKAVRDPDLAIHSPGHQGWQQLLNWKRELLSAYDRGLHYTRGHEVETYHGIVAEAHFRNWLSEFLPKKFGVTAGYIISQCAPAEEKTPAVDVIIYDQMESPLLWAEGHPDVSPSGKMRAFPAEYVRAVIEVKAAINTTSAKKAVEHLFDLEPLLAVDDPTATFKCYLPVGFTCWEETKGTQLISTCLCRGRGDGGLDATEDRRLGQAASNLTPATIGLPIRVAAAAQSRDRLNSPAALGDVKRSPHPGNPAPCFFRNACFCPPSSSWARWRPARERSGSSTARSRSTP